MKKWQYKTSGIDDELFIRGDVPMSKAEIRAVVISKLKLKNEHIVYDIGAGTGSTSIELAFQARKGKVFAVEKKQEGIKLIKKNRDSFGANNIEVIAGQAPEVLRDLDLPVPDRVFIGGSGGRLPGILSLINNNLNFKGRIVITAVTTNTLNLAIEQLKKMNYKLDICNISVTRTKKVSDYHMFKALNPVYIISGRKDG